MEESYIKKKIKNEVKGLNDKEVEDLIKGFSENNTLPKTEKELEEIIDVLKNTDYDYLFDDRELDELEDIDD